MNSESWSGESTQGESCLADELYMLGDYKSSVAVYQTTICERCTEEHNQLFKAWITTDSIKIFSVAFAFMRIVLYVTFFYM